MATDIEATTKAPLSPSRPTVLLADDSSAVRAFFKGAIPDTHVKLITAEQPLQALALLESETPDCILSDYEMPEMNGVEFCRRIRGDARWRDIPFIVLSMKHDDDKIIECLAAGADDYLPKQTSPAVIIAKIRLFTEVRHARRLALAHERMKTYNATLASLKHEWNNLLSILALTLKRMEGTALQNELVPLQKQLDRIVATIRSFTEIESVEFEDYIGRGARATPMVKVSPNKK